MRKSKVILGIVMGVITLCGCTSNNEVSDIEDNKQESTSVVSSSIVESNIETIFNEDSEETGVNEVEDIHIETIETSEDMSVETNIETKEDIKTDETLENTDDIVVIGDDITGYIELPQGYEWGKIPQESLPNKQNGLILSNCGAVTKNTVFGITMTTFSENAFHPELSLEDIMNEYSKASIAARPSTEVLSVEQEEDFNNAVCSVSKFYSTNYEKDTYTKTIFFRCDGEKSTHLIEILSMDEDLIENTDFVKTFSHKR